MATETGTASDYKDLLLKLADFLTGVNSPSSGLEWEIVREFSDRNSPDNSFPGADLPSELSADSVDGYEFIFRGTGGQSPELDIYFGVRTYRNSALTVHNWEIRGFTGYNDTSPETDFEDQIGFSPATFLPLQNTTMTYWFFATNRRVIVVVKTGTSYQNMYAGFINPFATEGEYPYPLLVTGMTGDPDMNFATNDIGLSGLPRPRGGENDNIINPNNKYDGQANGFIRWVDGFWKGIKNFYEQGASEQAADQYQDHNLSVMPLADYNPGLYYASIEEPVDSAADIMFYEKFLNNTPGGDPSNFLLQGYGSPAPTPLFPLTLVYPGQNAIVGEIDGIFWGTSQGGLTAEDTLLDSNESPEKEYIFFQNGFRTDPWTFLAVRND